MPEYVTKEMMMSVQPDIAKKKNDVIQKISFEKFTGCEALFLSDKYAIKGSPEEIRKIKKSARFSVYR